MKFSASVIFLLLVATCVRGGVVISWRPSPSPVPVPSSGGDVLPPWSDPGNVTDVRTGFVPLLRNGQLFNETVSVPLTERTDMISPHSAMVAAEDFRMPLALQSCTGLVADLVLFRQLGRTGGNYRVPTRTTFWLFPDDAMAGPFNTSRALAERVFAQPLEGKYDPPGATGGSTVDRGNGYYYHIERLRFMLGNITLRANATYWLAALVSIDRAYNASDFTQNTVRWAVSESASNSSSSPYRVVDWYHNTFRDVTALAKWTDASLAETYILPSVTGVNVRASRTRQLALDIYATGCVNVTRLPVSVTVLSALPPRESTPAEVTPSWSMSPTKEVVAVETPVSSPTPVPSSAWPSPLDVPSSVWPSPLAVPSSVWQSPSPSLGGPSPSPSLGGPSPSPSLSVTPSLVPSPVIVSSWMAPSPLHEPMPSSAVVTHEPPAQQSPSPVEKASIKQTEAIPVQVWVLVGAGAIIFLLLVAIIMVLGVRCYNGKRKYTNIDYATYRQEHEDASNESPRSQQKQPLSGTKDASEIILDDMEEEYEDEVAPSSREDAKAKQDRLLMQSVVLSDDK